MSSSSSSWYRVAHGLQMVANAAAKTTASDVGRISLRHSQHAAELVHRASMSLTETMTKATTAVAVAPQPPIIIPTQPAAQPQSVHEQQQQPPPSATVPNDASPQHFAQDAKPLSSDLTTTTSSVQIIAPRDKEESHQTSAETTTMERNQAISAAASSSTIHNPQNSEPLIQEQNQINSPPEPQQQPNPMKEMESSNNTVLTEGRAVPSTRVGRAFGFAQLGLGLLAGAAVEGISRAIGGSDGGSVLVNDANSDRLAANLCRMRGAALKMGQMLSIQDESLLPPALARALQQVRQGAEAMPKRQLYQQLEQQLGQEWRLRFESFEEAPFAAASIGQCHRAVIRTTADETRNVVVKVQYPGVGRSIESDLQNLSMFVTMTGLAPKGLFIENVIRVGKQELKVECDYLREMENQKRIKKLVESDPVLVANKFVVPNVIDSLSTNEILTTEYIPGGTIDKVSHLDKEERNRIGRTILYLTMKELFEWRFMQTDPNWGNFIYDVGTGTTGLIDFGATRDYDKSFVDGYLRIVWANANRDEETLMEQSHRMKFLTGNENAEMLNAHKMSGFTVGEPFWKNEPFDFQGSNISTRMGEHTAVFLQHRLTAPPEEVYTLHRKLAGAYMLCIKLGAIVESRSMLEEFVSKHEFDDGLPHPIHG